MKYYLYREQRNEGCDYTIGCGVQLKSLRATTREEAMKEIIGLVSPNWKEELVQAAKDCGYSVDDYVHDYVMYDSTYLGDVDPAGDRVMSDITLLEVNDEIDMMPLLKSKFEELKSFQKELNEQEKEAAERAQYEKLRKKFDK